MIKTESADISCGLTLRNIEIKLTPVNFHDFHKEQFQHIQAEGL